MSVFFVDVGIHLLRFPDEFMRGGNTAVKEQGSSLRGGMVRAASAKMRSAAIHGMREVTSSPMAALGDFVLGAFAAAHRE